MERYNTKQGGQEYLNEKHCKILYRQGLTIAKWINKFDSEDVKEEVYEMPSNLQEFEMFVNNSFEEIGEYLFSHTRNLFKRKTVKNDISAELLKLRKFFKDKKELLNTGPSQQKIKNTYYVG